MRQGSVGGPLKWVVFVHYWLAWVKSKMKGKGYKMSEDGSQRTMEEALSHQRREPTETIGKQFIDDSIWTADSGVHMQEMVRMHETFCNFHQVFLHTTKCEYFAMNNANTEVPCS